MTEISVRALSMQIFDGSTNNGSWEPVPAEMRYDTGDPLAMTLRFGDGGPGSVDWVFAFDLFYRMSVGWAKVGIGDVRLDVDALRPEYVLVRLASPEGRAVFRMPIVEMKKFVSAVKALIPSQPERDLVAEKLEEEINAILKG